MRVVFQINYRTVWGQTLYVCGSHTTLGNWNTANALEMRYAGNGNWTAEVSMNKRGKVLYRYFVKHENDTIAWENSADRVLKSNSDFVFLHDEWRPQRNIDTLFSTKVFTQALIKPVIMAEPDNHDAEAYLRFSVTVPRIAPNHRLMLCGNQPALGNWKPEKAMEMHNAEFPLWRAAVSLKNISFPLEYKYLIVDNNTGHLVMWEHGPERRLTQVDALESSFEYCVSDNGFRFEPHNQWRGAGVAVPVFSLRSNSSFGVGEFADLKKLADWAVATGLKMIQILPVNETVATHSWLDSYPYKAISVMALHPMFLNLKMLGDLDDGNEMAQFEKQKKQLNAKPFVDYIEVTKAKSRYFKLIFDQNWTKVCKTSAYKRFFKANKAWLEPYAAFCYLRDKFKNPDFRTWGEYAIYNQAKIADLCSPDQPFFEHIAVHYYIQFNLDLQLTEAVDYMHNKGVALKGDLPIGISPDSVEAWTEPALFNLNGQAGAPPDDFAVLGQNWGFPTYNWDEMEKDGYAWWKKRLNMMSRYFDAYRIDHILGFFRIWEIPKDAMHGLLGRFKPALAMSVDEIQNYGFWFDTDRFTKPYIRAHFLHDYFGEYAGEVKAKYLLTSDGVSYSLIDGFETQRKIFDHFTPDGIDEHLTEKMVVIRDGLISLLDEVLFLRDPYTRSVTYHPRIALHFSNSYRELDDYIKQRIDELYIDFFYQRHDQFWQEMAYRTLPSLIESSNMLVCGEDLGMVPASVPEVMANLNILSLEIQRMPKDPNVEFGRPADAPYLSVCTTSTHDMSTIRGWWEEDPGKTNRFFNHILGYHGSAPYFAEPWVCEAIIRQHLQSPAMWSILPIQDLLSMDAGLRWEKTQMEQINTPSNPRNKWQYRMVLSLEELLKATHFNGRLREMVNAAGRFGIY